jgi:hypothetical protein
MRAIGGGGSWRAELLVERCRVVAHRERKDEEPSTIRAMKFRFVRRPALVLAVLGVSIGCSTPRPPADAGDSSVLSDISQPDSMLDDVPVLDTGVDTGVDVAPDVLTPTEPVIARFEIPAMGPAPNQFLLPWPSDLAVDSMGKVDLRYIPGVMAGGLARTYVEQMAGKLDGFSPAGATYFRFSAIIDPRSLPATPGASVMPDASVQIVNVDPRSSEVGRSTPAIFQFRIFASRYWPANTLAVAPAPGFPLRPRTRYAVIVTDRLRGGDGTPVRRDADFTSAIGETVPARLMRVADVYKPALMALPEALRSRVASMAVFTTSDPTEQFFRAVDVTLASAREPAVRMVMPSGSNEFYAIYRGTFGPNPVFQSGPAPYDAEGSGDFVADGAGAPIIQRYEESIAFALTVPAGPMPTNGWPIAIYAHGTGGDSDSFISDGTARSLAAQGIACLGFDQLFNGARTVAGGSPEGQFFNFANPLAARSNNRQAGIDLVQAGRLVRTLTLSAMVSGGAEVHFDGANVMFYGHSQGGLNGPLWLAAAQGPAAAVLSGAGGWLSLSLVLKTQPVNIPGIVAGLLSVPPSELTPLHPAITLAQTIADPADPAHYGRYIVNEPRMGGAPRHVFLTQGFLDRYTPPPAIAALATSIGLPLIEPVTHPDVAAPLADWPRVRAPFSRNLAMGAATGGWSQYNAPGRTDGHFVIFNVPEATLRAARFLSTYVANRATGPRVE